METARALRGPLGQFGQRRARDGGDVGSPRQKVGRGGQFRPRAQTGERPSGQIEVARVGDDVGDRVDGSGPDPAVLLPAAQFGYEFVSGGLPDPSRRSRPRAAPV